MPDGTWPEFERALPALSQEMPAEVASMKDRTVRPMGALEKALFGRAVTAITHPNGTIAYNRDAAESAALAPEDVMAHELTHVRQINQRGMLGQIARMLKEASVPYMDRQDEKDAYAVENTKFGQRRRTQDIDLPRSK